MRSTKHLALCAVFGIVLPILCFVADPFVMGRWLSFGSSAFVSLYVYGVAVLSMLAMLTWIVVGGRSRAVDLVVAGVLFVGAGAATLVGIILLPITFIGLFAVIGALGLVPFGTAAVCWSAARRALGPDRTAWDLAAGAAMIVLLLAGGYAVAGDAAISNATRAFRYGWDRGSQVQAIEDLARWRGFLPDKVIARQTSGRLGPGMFESFADRYREVTGVDLMAVDPFGAGD